MYNRSSITFLHASLTHVKTVRGLGNTSKPVLFSPSLYKIFIKREPKLLNGFTYSSLTFERWFNCFAIIGYCPISFKHRTCMGWCGLHVLEQKGGNVKNEKGEGLCYSKDPYKSRPGCLCHQTTQEPNKPSKRTYLSDHSITPSNKHPDRFIWMLHVHKDVCACACMHVCVAMQFNKCSCVYSII